MKNRESRNQIHRLKSVLCLAAVLGASLAGAVAQTNRTVGRVVAWGRNSSGQTNVPAGLNGVIGIAGGSEHSLALQSNGTVVAWGNNDSGQTNVPSGLNGVLAIAAGYGHSLALRSNGTVTAWGWNSSGQTNVPAGLTGVRAIAAGYYYSMALRSNGTVVVWGGNSNGQTNVPGGLSGVMAIAARGHHCLALKSNGTVVAWGDNEEGQCTVPGSLNSVRAIATGSYHSLALISDGTVVAWGAGSPGQSGGVHYGQSTPPPGLAEVIAIAAGGYHSLALVATEPPTIIKTLPASQTVALGDTVNFSVVASGSSPRHYQWFFNATNSIVDATNAALQLPDVQFSQAGTYSVVVTNAFGAVTSSPALLTVTAVPVIVSAPTNRTTWTGATADFSAEAVGILPMAYQWFMNDTNVVSGATNTTLQLANVQSWQAGMYTVVVTNSYGAVTSAPAALVLFPPTVLVATEAALRAAMAGGGTVTFACDGTITLAGQIRIETDTVLDGSGHQVTISGSNAVPVFVVLNGVKFSVVNLAIANGQGGVVNLGGLVDLVGVEFRTNRVTSGWGPWREFSGAGVLNNRGGTVNATNCTFVGNTAEAPQWNGTPATPAYGGAVFNENGQVNLHACEFISNLASGGGGAGGAGSPYANPFPGAVGAGGAVANLSGTVTMDLCAFQANTAVGGQGGSGLLISLVGPPGADGGPGLGGAVFNLGTQVVTRTVFAGNALAGGAGGHGADGHGPQTGGSGGRAGGGAIYNAGLLDASGSTFAGNTLRGGVGGDGGQAAPDHFGAAGGRGGDAQGGALLSSGTGSVQNCTFAWNTNFGGVGGQGGGASMYARGGGGGDGGDARGGICLSGNSLDLVNCTVAFNSSAGGPGGAGGYGGTPGAPGSSGGAKGGGISSSAGARLVNTLLATTAPGGNCYGPLTDLGHNLSSDASFAFTNIGSLNNTDPLLASLADNGGPTLTMALLPGSPAIDAGDNAAAPTTDQRGHPRPVGLAADIGAYEYGTTPRLRIGLPLDGTVEILLYDASGPSCRLFTSATLVDWQCVATNQVGADGTALFQEKVAVGETQRFYRVAVP